MKPTPWLDVEKYRMKLMLDVNVFGSDIGIFEIPHPKTGVMLRVIVSSARSAAAEGLPPWDHVSVSLQNRCPNWPEMEFIKRLFFADDEPAMQVHPPLADYRNCHPWTLHLWKPAYIEIPLPPGDMVG